MISLVPYKRKLDSRPVQVSTILYYWTGAISINKQSEVPHAIDFLKNVRKGLYRSKNTLNLKFAWCPKNIKHYRYLWEACRSVHLEEAK